MYFLVCVHTCTHTCVCYLLSCLFATPWTVAREAPLSMGFPRQEYWSGLPCLLQGIFPIQGSNLGLLHCRQILYYLSHHGSPCISLLANKLIVNFSKIIKVFLFFLSFSSSHFHSFLSLSLIFSPFPLVSFLNPSKNKGHLLYGICPEILTLQPIIRDKICAEMKRKV